MCSDDVLFLEELMASCFWNLHTNDQSHCQESEAHNFSPKTIGLLVCDLC